MPGIRMREMRLATWSIVNLCRTKPLMELSKVLRQYEITVAALQEIDRRGHGSLENREGDLVFYSGHPTEKGLGTGFWVAASAKSTIKSFKPVNGRLCTLRIRALFYSVTIICVLAPTEESDMEVKQNFYRLLQETIVKIPHCDMILIVGNFDAKVGKEESAKPIVGRYSIHENSDANGQMLIDFAIFNEMIIGGTLFQHKKIHKGTRKSKDGHTSQVDHILIQRCHKSSIDDVRSCRGANIGSDHYMVVAKLKFRISNIKNAEEKKDDSLKIKRLRRQENEEYQSSGPSTSNHLQTS